MKIKSLIKLICLLVIVAALGLWAFGANVSLFGKKFISWDNGMLKGGDIGQSISYVFNITAPKDVQNFDAHAEAIKAVDVLNKRAELMDYKDADVRVMGKDSVIVTMPLSEAQMLGGISLFSYPGKLTVTKGSEVIFNEKDIKSAKFTGGEASVDGKTYTYYVDVTFNKEASARLKSVTSNGAYTLTFAMDTDKAKATLTGSNMIKNGKATLKFTDYNAANAFVICMNSGSIEGSVAMLENSESPLSDVILTGTAGERAINVLAFAALAILVVTALYFILSNKLLGLAATLSAFIGFIALTFFSATFNWLIVNASAIAGILVAILLMIFAHIIILNNVVRQYAKGKDVLSALDTGIQDERKVILEISLVAVVLGIGLWIIGSEFASFGIALMGGSVITAIVSIFVLKFIAKIFVGLGASTKLLGLKRGE